MSLGSSLDPHQLTRRLGWFGIGLGLASLATPRLLGRAIGVRDAGGGVGMLRFVGMRELACGVGILTQPRPVGWLWARVAGDLMDLTLLGAALASPNAKRGRVAIATTAVVGVTALDMMAAQELSAGDGARVGARRRHTVKVRRAITINRPPEQLYKFWHDFTNLPRFIRDLESVQVTGERRSHWKAKGPGGVTVEWDAEITEDRPNQRIAWRSLEGSPVEHSGVVRFERAPGGRGTEVIVEMEYTPPGGMIAAKIAKLLGQAPEQQVQENLRRFKQLMETGEIPVSEGIVRGAAQPPEREESVRAVAKGGA